jgi:putative serine protease PepD
MSNEQNPYDGTSSEPRPERGEEPTSEWAPAESWSPYGYAAPPRPTSGQAETQPIGQPGAMPGGQNGDVATAGLPPARSRRRRGAGLAASVVAASVLIGGAAGVGGAAVWSANHDTPAASSTNVAQVGSATASPAVNGSVEKVAQEVLPSVVMINVTGQGGTGSGSGIILSSDGEILTNNHVAAVAGKTGKMEVSFNDGTHAPAKILGTDPLTDTAVVKAQGVSGLTPATIGHSSSLQVGQTVVAIGSPFGLDATVTSGIVSALNRPVNVGQVSQGNATVYPAIQTDAAINPGNSGGPLVNTAGQVVGIDAAIQTATDTTTSGEPGSIGLGFAIPMDEVMPIVDQMIKGETPTHARLGISVENVANKFGAAVVSGAQVHQVDTGSAAAGAGLKTGDVITKVDNQLITSSDSLVATIRSYRPGDKVQVTYTRSGTSHTVTLALDSDATTTNS